MGEVLPLLAGLAGEVEGFLLMGPVGDLFLMTLLFTGCLNGEALTLLLWLLVTTGDLSMF